MIQTRICRTCNIKIVDFSYLTIDVIRLVNHKNGLLTNYVWMHTRAQYTKTTLDINQVQVRR